MAILTVTTASDENDGIDRGGVSLREAIAEAAPGDTIDFSNSLADATIVLTNGELRIGQELTVDGGDRNLTIDARGNSRVFYINDRDSAIAISVSLSGLTITGGSAREANGVPGNGGGIYNRELLSLENSAIAGNSASNDGGGLLNNGTANLTNSTISGNFAAYDGGGFANEDFIVLTNSTISGNTARYYGGGLLNEGSIALINSTVSGNFAAYRGGGIANSGGLASVANSTVSGNTANNAGGGIFNSGTEARLDLNSTIAANNTGRAANPDLANDPQDPGAIAASFSLIEAGTITEDGGNNITQRAPLLDPSGLQDNGGSTLTVALQTGSPAVDAGSNPDELLFDQRGEEFARQFANSPDIGAFEVQTEPPDRLTIDTFTDENDGSVTDGSINLRDAIGAIAPGGTITFANSGTISLALGEVAIAKPIAIDGGSNEIIIDAGGNSRAFNLDDGDNEEAIAIAISGVTIRGGSADRGGGIFNREALVLSNSAIASNSASETGGGVYNLGSLTLSQGAIASNSASETGGGIYNLGTLAFTNSTVSNNSAGSGGGIDNRQSLTFTNSTITGNSVSGEGGGIANEGTASLSNSPIAENSASERGGGIFNRETLTLNQSAIAGNSASETGGGIYNLGSIVLASSIANDNTAAGGGGIDNRQSLTLTNSTVTGNSVSGDGGGIANQGTAFLGNSTIASNVAGDAGGGIFNSGESAELTLDSTIAANNLANRSDSDLFNDSGTIAARFSLVEAGAIADEDGNLLGHDPRLGPLQANGGPTPTFALALDSPAIDTGSNPTNASFDQRGEEFARVVGPSADIGAFEIQTPINLVVDTFTDEIDGSITDGDISLRDAIDAIAPGSTITFATGGTIALTQGEIAIAKPLTIDGGSNDIVIDAGGNSRVFNLDDGDNEEAIAISLLGLTLSGGRSEANGGGIYNRESLTLVNSTLSGNSVSAGGGGIANLGTVSISNSTFVDNSAFEGGGSFNSGELSLVNSTVSGNSASAGGGLFNLGYAAIANSTVSDNLASAGGGLFNSDRISLSNSTVSGNSASDGGGLFNSGTASLANSTVSSNSAFEGGGISNSGDGASLSLASAIVADNVADRGTPDLANESGEVAANFSLIETGAIADAGENNLLGQDPLLGPLQDNGGPTATQALDPSSPAIDAGSNPDDLSFDQRGEEFARQFEGGLADIGAFELQSPPQLDPTLDADGDDDETAFNDGLIIFRFLAGLDASTFESAIAPGAPRDPTAIAAHLDDALQSDRLDADGNGTATAFNDGLIIFRFLAGLDASTFTSALAVDATRDPEAIAAFLEAL